MDIIKIRVKGYLKDIDEGKITNIDCLGIKNKDKISYLEDKVTNIIKQEDDVIYLIRESDEFKNILEFKLNAETISEYLLKENNFTIELNIKTTSIEKNDKSIKISYIVIDSDNEYEYYIEMSDKYEYKN